MKLIYVAPDNTHYIVDHVSAGDAVWLVMNTRRMGKEKFLERFPRAQVMVSRPATWAGFDAIWLDEELK